MTSTRYFRRGCIAGPLSFVSFAAATALLSACGRDSEKLEDAPHVDELSRLSWVEEIRIGSLDDPDEGFSRIGALAVADDGTLYVLESQAREVRVFGPDGRGLATRGRPGQGPGEFTRPAAIGLIGDTLWVRDAGNDRISWFDRDGSLVHETHGRRLSVETDVTGMTLGVVIGDPRPDGFVGSSYTRTMGGGAADRPFYVPIVRFDRQGTIVDTVRWDTVDVGPTVRVAGRPLHPPGLRPRSPVIEQLGDGRLELRWSGEAGLVEIVRLAASGDTTARSALRYEPLPLPAHVRDSLLEGHAGMGSLYGVSDAELAAAMASALELPGHRPPIRSTRVGTDRSLWIELNRPSPDSADWVVLGPELTPRGRTTLPLRMTPRHIDGLILWAIELDALDVPWLVRLRVME